ncbi:MFS transporter [Bacillus safensis]|uniref:MDR family MFS transporter n=1 Tax=Bacillus safensis TaxID=561879 RepID=UPI001BAE4503|nr:MFS transporter [Bacillus safensis]MBR0607486.1 MFS transporter [Bacillus safensis]WJE39818.1 MFS transporter [Bacillus safensis]
MKFTELHTNIKLRIVIGFFQRIINQMIIPFMAIYFAANFGIKMAGILSLSVILIGLLTSFIGGYYSDRLGRKPIILCSEFGNFLVFLIMALVNSPWLVSPEITYILFILNNIFTNLGKPAVDAMIVDVSTPKTRKYIYSINYWTINLSFAIGAMIGAFFYERYFFHILLIASLVTIVIFFIYLFFITESKPKRDSKSTNNKKNVSLLHIFLSYKDILKDVIFIRFVIVSIIIMGIEYQLAYYIGVRLVSEFNPISIESFLFDKINISGTEVYGILRMENTILVVLGVFLFEKLLKNLSDKHRLYYGTVLFTLGYMVLGSNNYLIYLLLAMFVLTVGEIAYVPIKQSILAIIIDDNARTRYMAVYGIHYRLGLVFASLSLLISSYVPSWFMSIFYGVMGLIALFLYKNLMNNGNVKSKLNKLSA